MRGPQHVARNFDRNFWPKFRQQFQNSIFFFRKIAKIGIFETSISDGRRCARSKIFFWLNLNWFVEKICFPAQSCGAPPQPFRNRFWLISINFWRKFMILTWWSLIFIQFWRAVSSRIFYRILPNRVSEHLGPNGSSLCCRNFLLKFLT